MTNEDKKLIADYMGWYEDSFFKGYRTLNGHAINFDSNDASLVVAEMQKRGEIDDFTKDALMICLKTTKVKALPINFTSWLMSTEDGQAKNFFKAFTEWRNGK